jgi:ligand-binding SRPBCC domain-containing protein
MAAYRLEREQIIPRPMEEVFRYFSRAENLETLTPPFLRFRILSKPPIHMREGTHLEYALRLYCIPIRWRTLIEAWEPERRFVDVQVRGPYKLWRHTHSFEAVPAGTLMVDTVDYALHFGPLGALMHAVLVRRSLDRIFTYRRQKIRTLMG